MEAYQSYPTRGSNIQINESVDGEPIERRVERIMNNKEPISDGAPLIYTERKDGVDPLHNIRTDRFDLALESTDKITQMALAKRAEFQQTQETNTTQQPAGPITPA